MRTAPSHPARHPCRAPIKLNRALYWWKNDATRTSQRQIMSHETRPHWKLPRGVTRSLWEYAHAEHIATEYDEYFADNQLFDVDAQVIARHFTSPGVVVDLGCGTGRALVPLARRGFMPVGVDLSNHMLRMVAEKAAREKLKIHRIRANLVDLGFLRDESIDYAICLFSTLGMIRSRENRGRTLDHVFRMLKPGGLLVIHVHNYWFNLFDRLGRRWIVRNLRDWTFNRQIELGDKFFDYRGVPKMFLHTFTQREFVKDLRRSGFRIRELTPLNVPRTGRLAASWFFGSLRANGWIAVAEK